jgi:hypothetical protein
MVCMDCLRQVEPEPEGLRERRDCTTGHSRMGGRIELPELERTQHSIMPHLVSGSRRSLRFPRVSFLVPSEWHGGVRNLARKSMAPAAGSDACTRTSPTPTSSYPSFICSSNIPLPLTYHPLVWRRERERERESELACGEHFWRDPISDRAAVG